MKAVFDASAVLAVMQGEAGAEIATAYLAGAVISAVNYAEVVGKLIENGMPVEAAMLGVAKLIREVVPFTEEQARITAGLRKETCSLGLSLGDRACLALGRTTGLLVITADRVWSDVQDVDVLPIR